MPAQTSALDTIEQHTSTTARWDATVSADLSAIRGIRRFVHMPTVAPTARVRFTGRMLVHDPAAWDRVLDELAAPRDRG
jgi:hypothetical protein